MQAKVRVRDGLGEARFEFPEHALEEFEPDSGVSLPEPVQPAVVRPLSAVEVLAAKQKAASEAQAHAAREEANRLAQGAENAAALLRFPEVQELMGCLVLAFGRENLFSRIAASLFGERVGLVLTDEVCVTRRGIARLQSETRSKSCGGDGSYWTEYTTRTTIRPTAIVENFDAAVEAAKKARAAIVETGELPSNLIVRPSKTQRTVDR